MSALNIETCPDHQRCAICDTDLCETCDVGGGTSQCPHGDPICEGCNPIDWCGDCYVEDRDAGRERRGELLPFRDPWAGPTGRLIYPDDPPAVAAFINMCVRGEGGDAA